MFYKSKTIEALLLLSAVAAWGCSALPTDREPAGARGEVTISADLTNLMVSGLVVEVTAPDIPNPLVFNIPIVGGIGTGTITIPAGSDRTVTITAFDAGGVATHQGSTTVDVAGGTNPPISITLVPIEGDVPIEVKGDGLLVTVGPPGAVVAVGQTVPLLATVTDIDGNPVNVPVQWGSTNPLKATVDASGVVTGVAAGAVDVVASAGGASGLTTVTVTSASVLSFTLVFENQFVDLDAGVVGDCDPTTFCSSANPPGWDLTIGFNALAPVNAFVQPNSPDGVEIANLPGALFEDVTSTDAAAATFGPPSPNEPPFDGTGVVLIKTDLGRVYKLGNPVETVLDVRFDAQLLLAPPPGPIVSFTLAFESQVLDLDAATVVDCDLNVGCVPGPTGWDVMISLNALVLPGSRVAPNDGAGVQTAHLVGAIFDQVTAANIATAVFMSGTLDEPFDATRVVLVRTEQGAVYKLGNPVETSGDVTFDTQFLSGS